MEVILEFKNMKKLKRLLLADIDQEKAQINIELLHLDLIAEILSRLDVESLYRFKCVCKTWCNLISDHSFMDQHRKKSMRNIKIVSQVQSSSEIGKSSLRISSKKFCPWTSWNTQRFCRCSDLLTLTFEDIEQFCPVSCDLICFSTRNGTVRLCNPILKQVQDLPKSSTAVRNSKLGFGYSSSTREYKVVRLFLSRKTKGMECETFTISDPSKLKSSSWLISKEKCPCRVYSKSITVSGRIYWLIKHTVPLSRLRTDEFIVSFEIEKESFKIISHPPNWPPKRSYEGHVEFMVFQGLLCITNDKSIRKNGMLEIWTLKDNSFWMQIYRIKLADYVIEKTLFFPTLVTSLRPKCIIDGEIIFKVSDDDMFYLFNLEKKTFIGLEGLSRNRSLTFGVYWESLFELERK